LLNQSTIIVFLTQFSFDFSSDFSKAFWRKSAIKHKLWMLVYLSSTLCGNSYIGKWLCHY